MWLIIASLISLHYQISCVKNQAITMIHIRIRCFWASVQHQLDKIQRFLGHLISPLKVQEERMVQLVWMTI